MNFRKIWIETPAFISGVIVLSVLLLLIGLVVASCFFTHYASSLKYAIAATIGGVLAYKALINRKIVLDEDRVIDGKLMIAIGWISSLLFVLSASLAILRLGK